MDEERYQKELFEFEKPNKPLSKLAGILPKPDFEGKIAVTLTLERMVFISIGIIMAMIAVFALGVESGRCRLAAKASYAVRPQAVPAAGPAQKARQQPQIKTGPILRSPAGAAPAAQGPSQKGFLNTSAVAAARTDTPADPSRPYTILAATFIKKDAAQAAAAFLKKEGLSSFVTYTDPYYRVCVGAYAEMQGPQVQRDLVTVKRTYKDAFVRPR
jgi:hypothetical protein